jgi:raffinose/stachyose/melibiose transport system substrate-binding protein
LKRIRFSLILVVVCVVLFSGMSLANEKVTVRVLDYFTAADNSTPIYEDVFKQFEKDFPDVKIQHEGLESASCRDKLAIEMASGNPPDIAFMVTSLGLEYFKEGLLLDLAPYMKKDQNWLSNYMDFAINANTWEGRVFLAPAHAHYGGLYINKRVINKVGIENPPTTWEELISQINKIKAAGINPFLTGGKEFRWAWIFSQIFVRTSGLDNMNELYNGTQVTGWNKPENGFLDALKKFKELVDAGAFPKDINGLGRTIARMMFCDEQGAMWYEGSWKVGVFANDCGIDFLKYLDWVPFPKIEGAKGDQDAGIGGSVLGFGVSAKLTGRKKEAAIELVKRLTDRETSTRLLVENQQPTGTKVYDYAWDKVHPLLTKQLKYYQTLDKVAYPCDVAAVAPVDNAIKKIAIPGIIDGTLTLEEAAEEVNKRAKEYFK